MRSLFIFITLLFVEIYSQLAPLSKNEAHQATAALGFTQTVYRGSIVESFPVTNETLRIIVPIDPPIRLTQRNAADSVQFSILGGNDDGVFSIDSITGKLFVLRQIDRENLPPSAAGGRFTLMIQASSVSETAKTRVVVDVLDINDNAPSFRPDKYAISIVENLPSGFNVLRVMAFDPDSDENGRFAYRLTDPSGAFKIDSITGWLSVADSTPLDREKTSSLAVLVEAIEERPSLVSANKSSPSVRIDIELSDANDNSPVFQPSNLYKFSVQADSETGAIVGQVLALDVDSNENGRVNYAIQHHEADGKWRNATVGSSSGMPFSVHPHSGHLIVVDAPLTKSAYQLIVEASDEPVNPSERRVSIAIVQIVVESHSAKVLAFLNTPYEFWIVTSVPVNTSVGQVKAAGSDVRYTLRQDAANPAPLILDSRSGGLHVTGVLAAFPESTYHMNVTASNGISEVTAPITVHIVRDSTGRSLSAGRSKKEALVFRFNVTENLPNAVIGHVVYPGDAHSYEYVPLDQQADGWLSLKLGPNGTLRTRKALDREQSPNLTEFVTVRDKDRAVDTVQIVVTVLDVNDNGPIFSQSRYLGRVKENALAGTVVSLDRRIETSDADEWPNNQTRFSLLGNGSRQFKIDTISGVVSVARSRNLDRERTPMYSLIVVATDDAHKFTSTAELTVVIDDVNDNPPEIVSFFPASGVVALERSPERASTDLGDHIVICSDGSCSTPIGLDVSDPQLPFGRSKSIFNKVRSQLQQVMDEWLNTAESNNATLLDEERALDKAFREVLHNASILIQVPEDFAINASIGSFRTDDRDLTPSVGLRFTMRPEHENELPFAIRARNGTLILKHALIPDKTYSFRVRVTDGQGLTSETSVALQVVDVNNHRPVFEQPFYEFHLEEGLYHFAPLAFVEAIDRDGGENARVTYMLSNRTVHPFEIDEESGRIFVDGLIDRELVEFYRFTVHATDHGWPPLKNQVEIVVYVEDVNDNAPQFELVPVEGNATNHQPFFSASVADGTPPGVPVIRIKASDADVDTRTNGNVTYQLASHFHLFDIEPVTGALFTKSTIDSEKLGNELNVVVVAADHGTPSLSTVGVVHVNVVKGCRGGLMPRRQQTIALDEDVPYPLLLVNLTANEADNKHGIQLLLARIEPAVTQPLFTVGQTEPVLWLTGPLDYETEKKYVVYTKVQRTDPDGPNSEATSCWDTTNEELVVFIYVNDVNDNAPLFREPDPIVSAVYSDSPIGSVIHQLSATDADDGENGDIRYSLTYIKQEQEKIDGNTMSNDAFDIDAATGAISVATSLEQLAGNVLFYQVEATDRNGAGLSSYLRLSIHVLGIENQIALVLATRTEELANHSANISRAVSDISGMDVWVKSVEPHVEGDAINSAVSEIVLYAQNQSGERLVSSEEFARILNAKRSDLNQKLQRYQLKAIRDLNRARKSRSAFSATRMEVLEVTLITLAIAILLGALVAVVFVACSRARINRKQRDLLPKSALAIGMDYHLQPLRNFSGPFIRSTEDALVESSSLSSDVYAEVSSEKGNADIFVSGLHPAKERQRRGQPEIPMCSSCRRREKMHCRCNCVRKVRRSNTQRRSAGAATEKKLRRHHSFSAYSCGHRVQHRKADAAAVNKQVRLHVPHGALTHLAASSENIVRELERSVAEEEQQQHKQQRSRRSSSGVSTLDVRRQLFQHSDAADNRFSSSSGGFEDSLNSDRHRARSKR